MKTELKPSTNWRKIMALEKVRMSAIKMWNLKLLNDTEAKIAELKRQENEVLDAIIKELKAEQCHAK